MIDVNRSYPNPEVKDPFWNYKFIDLSSGYTESFPENKN